MSINISQKFPIYKQQVNVERKSLSTSLSCVNKDTFVPSFGFKTKRENYGLLHSIRNMFNVEHTPEINPTVEEILNSNSSPYAVELSKGVKARFGENIPAKNFECIMSPDEFRKRLPELSEKNFKGTTENIVNGFYCADLDYASNFSNGKGSIYDILEDVLEYANQYKTNNPDGEKFIFALTDRDSLEGIQRIIKIVGENPEKFKNVQILPAVKLSFTHEAPESNIGFENSEMLVYGINPFSPDLTKFIEKLSSKRKAMVLDFIREINRLYPEFSYNILDFAEQNSLKYLKDYTTVSNLYWRAREYAESKGDTVIRGKKLVPEKIKKDADGIIQELDRIYRGSDERSIPRYSSSLIDENSDLNRDIRTVFSTFSTHEEKEDGKVTSSAESLYDEMVDCLSKTEGTKPIMAISSPFYLSHYFEKRNTKTYDNVVKFIEKLQKESNGMLVAFESFSPNYRKDQYIDMDEVERFNDYMRKKTGLYEVGGDFDHALNGST